MSRIDCKEQQDSNKAAGSNEKKWKDWNTHRFQLNVPGKKNGHYDTESPNPGFSVQDFAGFDQKTKEKKENGTYQKSTFNGQLLELLYFLVQIIGVKPFNPSYVLKLIQVAEEQAEYEDEDKTRQVMTSTMIGAYFMW